MDRVKMFFLFGAGALLLFSCGQSPNTANVNISRSAGAPGANAPANTTGATSVSKPVGGSNQQAGRSEGLQRSGGVDPIEPADGGDNAIEAYTKNCMICHKDTGKGGKVTIEGKTINAADLTSAKMSARSDEKLLAGIKEGAPDDGMPAFKEKLSDDVIKGIVKHIRTLQVGLQ